MPPTDELDEDDDCDPVPLDVPAEPELAICPLVRFRLPLAELPPLGPPLPPEPLLSERTVGLDEPEPEFPPALPLRIAAPPALVAPALLTTLAPAYPLALAGTFKSSRPLAFDEFPVSSELPGPDELEVPVPVAAAVRYGPPGAVAPVFRGIPNAGPPGVPCADARLFAPVA